MQSNGGNLIKHLRKKMGVTQEELANKLFMSQRALSNIENGTTGLSIMDFYAAFQALGLPTEDFWIVHLTTQEFEGYLQYKKMRYCLCSGNVTALSDMYQSIINNPLAQRPFLSQFLSYVSVIIDNNMPGDQKLQTLFAALGRSIDAFEEPGQYRLNYNEVLIINEIALIYARLGQQKRAAVSLSTGHEEHTCPERDKAIALLSSIVQNMGNLRTTTEEDSMLFPKPHVDLSTLLMESGRFEEAAKICETTLELIKKYRYMRQLGSYASYQLGECYYKMKKSKKEYTPLFTMAYHTARAFGQNSLANQIKEEYTISS